LNIEMDSALEYDRDLILLDCIEKDPDATQASLASKLGVAIGTINWHLKRLVAKGYVKVRRAERHKLLYLITPEGIGLRASLTMDYINNQFRLYRLARERSLQALEQVRQAGQHRVGLAGDGDVAEICRLTALENGFTVVNEPGVPVLRVEHLKIFIEWQEG
jgi:DNA-binding MarR family transcriptional regulator